MTTPSLAERCRRIELLLLDVDGVLTEGQVTYGGPDLEIKAFHVRDGTALAAWRRMGKKTAIITGRTSEAVARRARELAIASLVQGAADKAEALERLLAEVGLAREQVAALGDDLQELALFEQVGLAVAVADACRDIRARAHYVTRTPGGRGAVREAIELILGCQGSWPTVVASFGRQAASG